MNLDAMAESTCALVVTFHPPAAALKCVEIARRQCGRVIVIDNGSLLDETTELRRLADETGGIEFVRNEANVGLAAALNQGWRLAVERGFEWILFLDQDTEPFPTMVGDLLATWQACPQPQRVGVIGSNHYDDQGRLAHAPKSGKAFAIVPFVVTSGSLSPLRVFGEVGPFRDDFFIDCVDIEFGYRLESRGMQSVLCSRPTMRHAWGAPTRHRALGVTLMASNHSPLRRYFIVRNVTYVHTRYLASFPIRCGIALARSFLDMALVLLLEDRKWLKAKAMAVGFVHGLFGWLGRAPVFLQS